jgi:hypothetical protein
VASLKRWLDLCRNTWKAPFFDEYKAWPKDHGQTLLADFDLPADAVAFDFGGYVGA